MPLTTEALLTNPKAFGLTTATPVQRAICRVIDGLPLGELASDPNVIAAFGGQEAIDALALLTHPPAEVYLVAAIRTGKSLLAATAGTKMALKCDLSMLRRGEVPRVSIVSLTMDNADVILKDHLIGTFTAKPMLARLLVKEPKGRSLFIRRPKDGRVVEIRVIAGKKAGGSLVSRWSAGVIFDEAPRMNGEADGVINFESSRRAVLKRLVKGAQLLAPGSPWAPRGPIYDATTKAFGKPTEHLVVIRAPGPVMNPVTWTPEECAKAKEQDVESYITDVLGEFADPSSAFLSSAELAAVTRKEPITAPRDADMSYAAAMDPAARGNGWTLVIAGRKTMLGGRVQVVVARVRQWQGSPLAPLDTKKVLLEVRDECYAYGVTTAWQDQHSYDAHASIGNEIGLNIEQAEANKEQHDARYEDFRARVRSRVQPVPPVTVGPVELPPQVPGIELPPDPVMRADLLAIRKKVTTRAMTFDLPTTADGRHADYAPAVVLAVAKAVEEVDWRGAMTKLRAAGGRFFG
jgi:hypothetical protein